MRNHSKMFRRTFIFATLALFCNMCIAAEGGIVNIPAIGKPKLDGVIDKAEWDKAANGVFFHSGTGNAPQHATTWRLGCDKDNLYITVHNRTDRVVIQIEPCRMWSPVIVVLNKKGQAALDGYGFRHSDPPEIGLEKTADGAERLSIPMSIFDGYRREGFPMRMNIRQAYKFWIKGEVWSYRLTHEDYNPKMAAWMVF